MNLPAWNLPITFPVPLVLLLLGLVLAPVIYWTLGQMKTAGLDLRPRALMALVVTLLCLLGLGRGVTPADGSLREGRAGGGLDFILLPYAALALAIPLVLLLRWLAPWIERRRQRRVERRVLVKPAGWQEKRYGAAGGKQEGRPKG